MIRNDRDLKAVQARIKETEDLLEIEPDIDNIRALSSMYVDVISYLNLRIVGLEEDYKEVCKDLSKAETELKDLSQQYY